MKTHKVDLLINISPPKESSSDIKSNYGSSTACENNLVSLLKSSLLIKGFVKVEDLKKDTNK